MSQRESELESGRVERRVFAATSLAEVGMTPQIDAQLGLATSPITLTQLTDKAVAGKIFLGLVDHPFVGEHFAHLLDLIKPVDSTFVPGWDYFYSRQGIEEDFRMILEARGLIKPWNPNLVPNFQEIDNLHMNDPRIKDAYGRFIDGHGMSFYKALQRDNSVTTTGILRAMQVVDIEKVADQNLERISEGQRMEASIAELTRGPIVFVDPNKEKGWSTHVTLRKRDHISFKRNGNDHLLINGPEGNVQVQIHPQESGKYDWRVEKYRKSPQQNPDALYPLIAWTNVDGIRRFMTQDEARPYLRYLTLPETGTPSWRIVCKLQL